MICPLRHCRLYFRAFTGAVTLKLHDHGCTVLQNHHFRAFTGAVTLKPDGLAFVGGRVENFRAFTGAVTLKLAHLLLDDADTCRSRRTIDEDREGGTEMTLNEPLVEEAALEWFGEHRDFADLSLSSCVNSSPRLPASSPGCRVRKAWINGSKRRGNPPNPDATSFQLTPPPSPPAEGIQNAHRD